MTKKNFDKQVKQIIACLDFMQVRKVGIKTICDWLSPICIIPKQRELQNQFFLDLDYSDTNQDIVRDAHRKLRDKVDLILQYDNKLVQVLEPNSATYHKLHKAFSNSHIKSITEFNTHDLLMNDKKEVKLAYNMGGRFEAFGTKSTIKETVKIDISDEVDNAIKSQYEDIYAIKNVILTALDVVIFDTEEEKIIVAVDLAGIAHSKLINVKISEFKVELKKKSTGLTFDPTPLNLFGKLKQFYAEKQDVVHHISFKTMDGVIHHEQANQSHPDARDSDYHVYGGKAVKGKLQIYRILKKFTTPRQTEYSIDLKSIANMTAVPDPVLFQATIRAQSADDFADALIRLL